MSTSFRSRVIRIGNSRGIRIPRALLEQADLTDGVEMTVEGGKLIISSVRNTRQDWGACFAVMAESGDDQLLIEELLPTQWDEEEWVW